MFHSDDYIHFLQHVSPDTQIDYGLELQRCTHKHTQTHTGDVVTNIV